MWKMKQNKNKQKTNTLKLVFKHSPHSVLWLSGICENHRYVIYFQERWCIRNFILKKSQLLLHSNQPNMFDSWLTKVFSPFYFTTAMNPLPTSKIIQLFFLSSSSLLPSLTFLFFLAAHESRCYLRVQEHRLAYLSHLTLSYQTQEYSLL